MAPKQGTGPEKTPVTPTESTRASTPSASAPVGFVSSEFAQGLLAITNTGKLHELSNQQLVDAVIYHCPHSGARETLKKFYQTLKETGSTGADAATEFLDKVGERLLVAGAGRSGKLDFAWKAANIHYGREVWVRNEVNALIRSGIIPEGCAHNPEGVRLDQAIGEKFTSLNNDYLQKGRAAQADDARNREAELAETKAAIAATYATTQTHFGSSAGKQTVRIEPAEQRPLSHYADNTRPSREQVAFTKKYAPNNVRLATEEAAQRTPSTQSSSARSVQKDSGPTQSGARSPTATPSAGAVSSVPSDGTVLEAAKKLYAYTANPEQIVNARECAKDLVRAKSPDQISELCKLIDEKISTAQGEVKERLVKSRQALAEAEVLAAVHKGDSGLIADKVSRFVNLHPDSKHIASFLYRMQEAGSGNVVKAVLDEMTPSARQQLDTLLKEKITQLGDTEVDARRRVVIGSLTASLSEYRRPQPASLSSQLNSAEPNSEKQPIPTVAA